MSHYIYVFVMLLNISCFHRRKTLRLAKEETSTQSERIHLDEETDEEMTLTPIPAELTTLSPLGGHD